MVNRLSTDDKTILISSSLLWSATPCGDQSCPNWLKLSLGHMPRQEGLWRMHRNDERNDLLVHFLSVLVKKHNVSLIGLALVLISNVWEEMM